VDSGVIGSLKPFGTQNEQRFAPTMNATRIAALFLLFGTAWILVSDSVLEAFVADSSSRAAVQTVKGMVFVVLSALLVYLLVRVAEKAHARLERSALLERDRLAQVLNVSPAVVYALRPGPHGEWAVEFVGDNVTTVTGFTKQHWINTPRFWASRVHPDDLPAALEAQKWGSKEGRLTYEYRFCRADGSHCWIHDEVLWEKDEFGKVTRVVGAWLDVTERHLAAEQARLVAQVFESSQEGIFITDADTRFISVNHAFTRITGYGLDELKEQTPALLHSGRHGKPFYRAMWADIAEHGRWEGEIWNRRKNGEIYPEWLTISAINGGDGKVARFLGLFTETSSRKDAEARIERLVNYDSLTNLPNRALLFDRANVALAAAQRNHTQVVLMHFNIDHFKIINETFGRDAGDQVLVTVAQRLVTHLKPEDTVTRLGSDDFAVLLPHTSALHAGEVARRLMALVEAPMTVAGQPMRITASVGVSEFPENGNTMDQLAQAAETAAVLAKREGRNNVRFFSASLQAQTDEARSIERDLHLAVERRQLVLHYQPQVSASTGHIVGVEALVRWQHPEWGLVPPARFIPLAEKAGLIRGIGEWVLLQALTDAAAWQAAGLPAVPVAVNLSMAQFRHEGLRPFVAQALVDKGLSAHLLELELTESVAMEDSEFTIATIQGLKDMGLQLSIDDFGTGYSSLSYLKRFAIDKLKIDQSFVRGLNVDSEDDAIVLAIIHLAHSLGLRTIAEGVETPEQAMSLRAKGCDEFQGYLFSRPVPAAELAVLLGKGPCALPGCARA
jgi:diguanylate cyclase (GGDEF)-like protein/PAS domain S-box-containing protein